MPDSKRHLCCLHVLIFFSLFFQFGCAQSSGTEPAVVIPRDAVSATPYSESFDVDLTASHVINNATVAISNRGSDSVVMPSVFVKGSASLNRDSILFLIRSAGPLTDEQFALASWHFITQHRQHYCSAGAQGDPFKDADDPMRLLHGYGLTCCDQSTDILVWLWREAGYQARAARMTFHEVPEINYQSAWHLYDADHEVYYLKEDNKTVASVADVIADPSLVARTADANGNDPVGYSAQWMANQYALATPAYEYDTPSDETTWSLRSSQTFTLQSANSTTSIFNGPDIDDIDNPLAPDAANSGQFDWELDFARPDWKKLTIHSSGVETLISGADAFLTNTSTSPGYVIYHLSSPFPVFSLVVSGMVYRGDSAAAVKAYLFHAGSPWSTAFPMNAEVGSPVQTTADLSSADVGQYSYFVKLELSGSAAQAARISAVHITSEVQVSKFLFPNLMPGVINNLIYQDWSPPADPHDIKISVAVQ